MTADAIRKIEVNSHKPEVSIAIFMRELAAQLAELNAHLNEVDAAVFGHKDTLRK